MRDTQKKINVTLPVWNEIDCLTNSLALVRDHLTGHDLNWEITIADNGSTDGTRELARELSEGDSRISLVTLPEAGRGDALRAAWLASDAAILTYMDVDLSTDLASFSALVEPLIDGRADIVVGSRLLSESDTERCWQRELISRTYARLTRLVMALPVSDFQCGFKAITLNVASTLLPLTTDRGWFFDTELLAIGHRLGYTIDEIPIRWREDRSSKVRILNTAWEDLKGLGRLRWAFERGDYLNCENRS